MRNPKRARLKKKLTPEQFAARQMQLTEKATWRKQAELGIAQAFGNANAVGQYAVKNIKRQVKINWALAVAIVVVATKAFGLWR